MSLRLEDVIRVTRAVPAGDGWLGHCPAPDHPDKNPSLDITRGTKQEVIYTCRTKRCDQGKITAALRKLIKTGPATSAPVPATKKPKATTKEWGWPDKWKPLSEETYRAICASRSHSYTPKLSTLRLFGFREKHVGDLGVCFAYPVYRKWLDESPALVKWATVDLFQDKDGKLKRKWFQFAPTTEVPQDVLVCGYYSLSNPNVYKDVLIVEGQWDALYLCELGYAAVGLLSAGQRELSETEKERLGDADRVFLLPDNDPSRTGHEAMEAIAELVPWQASPVVVDFPAGMKDMCELRAKLDSDDAVREALDRILEGQYTEPKTEPANKPTLDTVPHVKFPHIELVLERGDEIADVMMEFLWPRRIPKAQLSILCGVWDVGKGLLVANMVAALTTGRRWIDADNPNPPSSVLYLTAEDSPKYTVVPRLKAAGTDMKRVHFVKESVVHSGPRNKSERLTALNTDREAIESTCARHPDISLIVIDPISSYLGKEVNQNNVSHIKAVLDPLQAMAERTGLTILAIGHFNKNEKQSAVFRLAGSYAFSSTPRAVWVAGRNPDNESERFFVCTKCNALSDADKAGFTWEPRAVEHTYSDGKRGPVPVVKFLEASTQTANEAFTSTKQDEGVEFIENRLADGEWCESNKFWEDAAKERFTERTLRRSIALIRSRMDYTTDSKHRKYMRLKVAGVEPKPVGPRAEGTSMANGMPY